MTIQDLNNMRWAGKELDVVTEQIENLEAKAEKITTSLSETKVKTSRNLRSFEGYMNGIVALQEKAKMLISECMDSYTKAYDWLQTIEDSRIRQIICLRYISGKSWQQVANKLGGYETADSVRMAATRYIAHNCDAV